MYHTSKQRTFVVTNYFKTRSLKMFSNSLNNAFGIERVSPTKITIWKNVKTYETGGSSLNLNTDRKGHRRTERTQESINLQEMLIEDQRISARKNGLDISKRTFNRITKRDLKWHSYKMYARKERKNCK